jgi:hypothetical protein
VSIPFFFPACSVDPLMAGGRVFSVFKNMGHGSTLKQTEKTPIVYLPFFFSVVSVFKKQWNTDLH